MSLLKKIDFGSIDGPQEARSEHFADWFYQFEYRGKNIVEMAINGEEYLVLGRKGTGKTLLGHYLKRKSKENYNLFCELISYKQLNFNLLNKIYTKEETICRYTHIWKWTFLIELAKIFVSNKNELLTSSYALEKLKKIIKEIFPSKASSQSVLEKTINLKLSLKLFENLGVGFDYNSKNGKEATVNYLDYLDDLQKLVLEALQDSKEVCPEVRYLLVVDELDDQFDGSKIYEAGMVSLIWAVDELNKHFFNDKLGCKIIVLLRSDICDQLNDPNLQKPKEAYSIKLNWGSRVEKMSPLLKIITRKICVALNKKVDDTSRYHADILREYLPEKIGNIDLERFILERTCFRPRDIVAFFLKIKEESPEATSITEEVIKHGERAYSKHLLNEFRNELYGHLSNDTIKKIELLFSSMSVPKFYFDELLALNKRKNIFNENDILPILKILFEFSFLGNYNQATNAYTWKYRDTDAIFNEDLQIVIHLGLRKGLNLGVSRKLNTKP